MSAAASLADVYRDIWSLHRADALAELDQPLDCVQPEVLFDLAQAVGAGPTTQVVDVGCGTGDKDCELVRRFGCQVLGVELVESNLNRARDYVAEQGLAGNIRLVSGSIGQIPAADAAFDIVWCRDMLEHVPDLDAAFGECRRVIRAGGAMLLLSAFATDDLSPRELARAAGPLSIVPESLDRQRVLATIARQGFQIEQTIEAGGDFAEVAERRDQRATRELLRLSRLIRRPARFEALYGQPLAELAEALYRWVAYQLLGKVEYAAFVLRPVAGQR